MPRRRKPGDGRLDRLTRRWIRTAADERAARNGCRFDEARAQHILDFCENNLRLYEGEQAGQLVRLMPWQIDVLSRVFGWIRWSDDWQRWVRRFRIASLWIPKKNGKSPTAAMVGLYLLAADGEPGQKVFSAAKDGKQARIVHTHARLMVLQSETLDAECSVNNTTGRILHQPSYSFYDILAGDNISGQEGINGSIIIDETHVVDDRLAKVLEYAGASRAEPMRFEVSTAGPNVDGYGKRQQDYGRLVNAGKIHDDEFFCEIFEAPQNATDAECAKVSVWKKANPAWGHIIRADEFRSSHKRASRTLGDFTNFKMYRLNIWSASASPWLLLDDWNAGERPICDTDLQTLPAAVGLDLSKTRDMTSAVLVRYDTESETAYLKPHFWMPRSAAERNSHLAPFLEWAAAGHLTLTDGDVLDYSAVEEYLVALHQSSPFGELVYDPLFAEEITQRIADRTGCERIVFPQTITHFAGPTADFERLVIAHRLHHDGNPVMAWQIGHAQVKTDANGNKRPVKPKPGDVKKIDGVVAGIMGLARAITGPSSPTWYNDHDPEFI